MNILGVILMGVLALVVLAVGAAALLWFGTAAFYIIRIPFQIIYVLLVFGLKIILPVIGIGIVIFIVSKLSSLKKNTNKID